ncbi:MAG: hypothetical protein ACK4SN_15680, partial [Bellilinea sp.]
NFDLQQVFAENFISAQREATQEKVSATSVLEELKKERDAIEKELIKSTSSRVSALGLINKTLYGERGLEEAFNFSVRAQYQFLKLIGKIDEKKVTESQFAFGTLMALGDEELVRRYDEINKKILTFESNLAGKSESINARKGIKTTVFHTIHRAECRSESINARKGIKTQSRVSRCHRGLSTASESINARKGINDYFFHSMEG